MTTKVGSLYYLDCQEIAGQQVNAVEMKEPESKKKSTWHRQFGHVGVRNLQKLAQDNMINIFDFDMSNDLCIGGKHNSQFPKGTTTRSNEPLRSGPQ